jgi:hypothetical protein
MNRDKKQPPVGGRGPDDAGTAESPDDTAPADTTNETPSIDGMTQGKATGWPREPDRTHYRDRESL